MFSGLCTGIFITSAAGAFLGGPWAALSFPLPWLAAAHLWRDRWLPRFSRYARFQAATIIALYSSSAFYLLPRTRVGEAIASAVKPLAQKYYLPPLSDAPGASVAFAGLMLAAGIAVNLLLQRKEVTWVSANPDQSAVYVRRGEFQVSLQRYCDALIAELDRYDREVNWSDRELTPLEAEVETERTERLRPRIARDLIEAIRRNRRSNVFVVLGDPGSGKSVSLRRLVRVLCRQADKTGVVPIYVNLREYPPNEEPTPESLLRFVRAVTWRQTGRDGRTFVDTWYEPFRKSGRLFFVIDSFDELPAILDCDEKSDTHRRISSAFDRFFTQDVLTCRAVLASRQFRAPVDVRGTRLLIRPFTEMQVRRAMRTWLLGKGINIQSYLRRLFQERPHLATLLRNPFTAELIADYAISGNGVQLPANMYEVFDHYLSKRLEDDQGTYSVSNLAASEVRIAAGFIATEMYERKAFGLEADVDEVTALLSPGYGAKASGIIEALRYARLARVGGADRRRFSFVHRRFAEFFVVDFLRSAGGKIDLTSIPTDSRWRDCLVMCCGVLDLPSRTQVADYCWSVIKEARVQFKAGELGEARGAVHCIRFLADAFRCDPEALRGFRDSLSSLTLDLLGRPRDLLVAKIAAELIPLVDDTSQQLAVVAALESRSRWISDTTLNSCRHLSRINASTNVAIRRYFNSFSVPELLTRFHDLNFSLSLSDAFRARQMGLKLAVTETVVRGVLAAAFVGYALIHTPALLLLPLLIAAVGWGVHSWISTLDAPFYRGVLGFRDWIDAWSRLLVISLPVFYFAAGDAVHSSEWSWLQNAYLAVGVTPQITAEWLKIIIILMSILVCFRWETIARLAQTSSEAVLKRLAPSGTPGTDQSTTDGERVGSRRSDSPFVILIREPSLENFKVVGVIIAVVAGGGCIAFGLVTVWKVLSPRARAVIIALLISVVCGVGLFLFLKAVWFRGRNWVISARERRQMLQMGSPDVVSCVELYEYLSSLKSSSIQREFVQTLRFRRVKIEGALTNPPEGVLRNRQVAEELARLREHWLGLAN